MGDMRAFGHLTLQLFLFFFEQLSHVARQSMMVDQTPEPLQHTFPDSCKAWTVVVAALMDNLQDQRRRIPNFQGDTFERITFFVAGPFKKHSYQKKHFPCLYVPMLSTFLW